MTQMHAKQYTAVERQNTIVLYYILNTIKDFKHTSIQISVLVFYSIVQPSTIQLSSQVQDFT